MLPPLGQLFLRRGHVSDTCSTSLSTLSCPRQLWPYRTRSASCSRTTNVACTFVLFSGLLSYSNQFTTWSAVRTTNVACLFVLFNELLSSSDRFKPGRRFCWKAWNLLEEVVRGHLFLSPFSMSVNQVWTESLRCICSTTEPIRLSPREEIIQRELSFIDPIARHMSFFD